MWKPKYREKKNVVVIGNFYFYFICVCVHHRRNNSERFSRHITIKLVLFSRLHVDTGFQRRTTTFCRGKWWWWRYKQSEKICFSIQKKIHFRYNRKINSKFHQPNAYHLRVHWSLHISWQVIFVRFLFLSFYYYIISHTYTHQHR